MPNADSEKYINDMIDNLANMSSSAGFRPPRDHDDPVKWRLREFNKRAKQMCNIILAVLPAFTLRERP